MPVVVVTKTDFVKIHAHRGKFPMGQVVDVFGTGSGMEALIKFPDGTSTRIYTAHTYKDADCQRARNAFRIARATTIGKKR